MFHRLDTGVPAMTGRALSAMIFQIGAGSFTSADTNGKRAAREKASEGIGSEGRSEGLKGGLKGCLKGRAEGDSLTRALGI